MAYIQPSSIIQLFKGIDLDNRYLHTIYFANETAQNTWFTGKATSALTFNNMMYRRNLSNSVKIQMNAQKLLGVTYMRFKNSRTYAEGTPSVNTTYDKWFYCFVTGIEYVNENTTEIFYEIDVMQTWFIQNGSIKPCMVLREHVTDDSFGNYLEPEPVGSEAYVSDFITKSNHFNDFSLVEFNTMNPLANPNDPRPVLHNGLFNGSYMTATQIPNDPTQAQTACENIVNALDILFTGDWDVQTRKVDMIDMFTFPTDFCNQNASSNSYGIIVTNPFAFGNYTPKNKKLLTYPYNYLYATTMNGKNAVYRWEYFDGLYATSPSVTFTAYGNPVGGGKIICYPQLYDGITNNYDVSLVMDDFPKNPFNIDSYQAWVAAGGKTRLERESAYTNIRGFTAILDQSASSYANALSGLNGVGHNAIALGGTNTSIMDDMSGMASGSARMIKSGTGMINTAVNVAEAMNKIAYQWNDAYYRPNIIVGESSPNVSVPLRSLDFHFFNVHVKTNEAKHIDDFFSVFGYAINKVRTPHLTGRRYWNFVQTENCVIDGDMPASSKEAIGRIFDGGITFWHDGDKIGDYAQSVTNGSIDNPIVT